jgi:LDH2 family malate/lactate/ureidoglycolate dehydrogenase
MAENFVWVDFDLLERFMTDAFKAIGIPEEDSKVCAEVLITSDKRGIDSHGIGRFKAIYIDRINDGILNTKTEFEIVKEGPTTAVIDGHNGMGMVIGKKSMQMAIDKAKANGLGMVAVRNTTHYGIAGYYALMAIEQGMIGITGTNARPSIAPTFGVENMLGTNPLTIGFPTDEEFPFVLDCATSVTQRGKIESYSRLGKELPAGWVIGQDGRTKTDSTQVLKDLIAGTAALTPLGGIGDSTGGYKGYGYATVVEVLSAALQDGKYLKDLLGYDKDGNKIPYPLGHFFIAIDINAFLGQDIFRRIAGDIMRKLRSSDKMPGEERIYTAGEKEYEAWLFRKDKGAKVDKKLQQAIIEVRDRYGLSYHFDFEK